MKKSYLFALIAVVIFTINSCSKKSDFQKDDSNIPEVQQDKLNSAVAELSSNLGINVNAKVADVSYGSNNKVLSFVSKLKSGSQKNEWDVLNSSTIKFVTVNGDTLTSIAVPLKSDPTIMTCYVECNGRTNAYVLNCTFDEVNKTMSYTINNDIAPLQLKRLSNWMGCMKTVMGSHVGVIVTVAGVAGSLGCVPCAGVAGFYTGIAALACLG
jgi:hypothetical protein